MQKSKGFDKEDPLFDECVAVVLEWAEKLLGRPFESVRQLVEYMIVNSYVDAKSKAALTIRADMEGHSIPQIHTGPPFYSAAPSLFGSRTSLYYGVPESPGPASPNQIRSKMQEKVKSKRRSVSLVCVQLNTSIFMINIT